MAETSRSISSVENFDKSGYLIPSEAIYSTIQNPVADVQKYLLEHSAVYRELSLLRKKGWENPKGDDYFRKQRTRADHADSSAKQIFYNMMCQIGDELNESYPNLLPTSTEQIAILDLCMAPGGFTRSILKRKANATVHGISLPRSKGGHEILLPKWQSDSRIHINFLDVTMLATEMDVSMIPLEHPDAANFLSERPFCGQVFDLIFCDGQVLRMHPRAEYREEREKCRLLTSQLVLAMQRMKEGGTLVMLLHKLDAWDTINLLNLLRTFSSLRLFKPMKKHAARSSFYAVAMNLETQCDNFARAVELWKEDWRVATFGSNVEYKENRGQFDENVDTVLSEFGEQLIRLGEPIWKIQSGALRKAPFVQ